MQRMVASFNNFVCIFTKISNLLSKLLLVCDMNTACLRRICVQINLPRSLGVNSLIYINHKYPAVGVSDVGSNGTTIVQTWIYLGMLNWWEYLVPILDQRTAPMNASSTKSNEYNNGYGFHIGIDVSARKMLPRRLTTQSATRRTRRNDCNHDAHAGLGAAGVRQPHPSVRWGAARAQP